MTEDDQPIRLPLLNPRTASCFLDALTDAMLAHERRVQSTLFRDLLFRRLDWALRHPERVAPPDLRLTESQLRDLRAVRNALESMLQEDP